VRKRALHAAEVVPRLHQALAAHTALEWEALLGDDVPCAAARKVEDMFDHPQVLAEQMIGGFVHETIGPYRGVTRSVTFSRTPGPEPFAAPVLGQDSDTVAAAAGIAAAELQSLREQGVVR
jgi:crotonobetainyl-CoA:carnitine CoA-transferase CaiB-like acyl-CoA transferase